MFKNLFSKNKKLPSAENDGVAPLQLAIAALLVEAARADDHYDDRERGIVERSLQTQFDLSQEEAQKTRAEGEAAQADALDIQRFTKITKEMPAEDKISFIERLWEIILSDGEKDPFEDTLMRRICGLIYVEDRISGEARARVAAKLGGQ